MPNAHYQKKLVQKTRYSAHPFCWHAFIPKAFRCLVYLLCVLVIALVMYCWTMLKNPLNFPFRKIEVKATYQHINRLLLQKMMAHALYGGFFSFNSNEFRSEIMQKLPWIKTVAIRRIWPSTLFVTLTEKKVMAVWNHQSLVTPRGHLFQPQLSTFPKGLVELEGAPRSLKIVLRAYITLKPLLSQYGLALSCLEKTRHQIWHLTLKNGIHLRLGDQKMNQRLIRFLESYAQIIGHRATQVKTVDLRYPNGFAIQWSTQRS